MAIDVDSREQDSLWRCDRAHSWVRGGGPDFARGGYEAGKVVLDFTLSLVLLVVALPVMLVVALLVKLTSPGPALYSQTRLGRHGRPYRIYKFRTMWHNCEKQSGAVWSTPGDSRITPVGNFLRRTHLDELPQLWNVLCGEMSLVGPRPERPEFVPDLQRAIPHYGDRLLVRPGVTGLAQVQIPADTDLDSVRRKLRYDLYYIRQRSLWLDLRLIACTGLKVLCISPELTTRLLQVPGKDVVENAAVRLSPEVLPLPRMEAAG